MMMYRSYEAAQSALSRVAPRDLRVYRISGEEISPAEEWLLGYMVYLCDVKSSDGRKIIGLARSLGLYPIPAWWAVKEKISGDSVKSIIKDGFIMRAYCKNIFNILHQRKLKVTGAENE